MSDAAARATLARFGRLPLRERLHVRVRWHSCPMEEVAAAVPPTGDILEVGCGHGLFSQYLVASAPQRRVTGVDIDPHKIEQAAAAGAGDDRLRFALTSPGELPDGPFDAVAILDVLYLLPPDGRDQVVALAASRLAPGGVLVVKEVGTSPTWKARVAAAQERLSTGVLGITAGSYQGLESGETLAGRMAACGLATTVTPLGRGRLHPHVLVVGRAPDGDGQPGSD